MNREEHLKWCKNRALEYVDHGDNAQAYASFISDMSKHEETKHHSTLSLFTRMMLGGFIDTNAEMRKFIEGFN